MENKFELKKLVKLYHPFEGRIFWKDTTPNPEGENTRVLPKKITILFQCFTDNDIILEKTIGKFYDFEKSKKLFFTIKDYNEHLEDLVKTMNLHNYNTFTFTPKGHDVAYMQMNPSLLYFDDLPSQETTHPYFDDLTNQGVSKHSYRIKPMYPPIQIGRFKDLDYYEKKKIMKNWKGVNKLKKGSFAPLILNPASVLVEYSPFFDDENKRLVGIKKLIKKYMGEYKRDLMDVLGFIDFLISERERKQSKLDRLVDFLYLNKKEFVNIKMVKNIYGYYLAERNNITRNGFYVVRFGGDLEEYFHWVKNHEPSEYWVVRSFSNIIDVPHGKNVYYYIGGDYENLARSRTPTLGNGPERGTKITEKQYLELKGVRGHGLEIMKISFLKKRHYYADRILTHSGFVEFESLRGTIRARGIKSIYLIKGWGGVKKKKS